MATTSERTIISTSSQEGETYLVGPETVIIKFGGADTDGTQLVVEINTPPGGGPPVHTHLAQEVFLVLEGEFEFPTVRNGRREATRASVGDTIYIPSGIPHSYHNIGSVPGRLLGVLSPAAEMEGFFREAGVHVEDASQPPTLDPPDMGAFIAIAGKYNMTFTPPTE